MVVWKNPDFFLLKYTKAYKCRITWILKEYLYRDSSWETRCTLGSALFLFFGMAASFWVNMVLLVSGQVSGSNIPTFTTKSSLDGGRYAPEPARVCLIMLTFTLGIWLHHTADAQVSSRVE